MKIAHLTSAHPRYDTRIFLKQCISLVANGYETYLVVADGQGDEKKDSIQIYDAGKSTGRLNRILKAPSRVLNKALLINADLYQIHDPELIPIAIKLKSKGKKVVFDAHEDVPRQLLGKPYLNKPILWCLSKAFSFFEIWACKKLDGIITATPFIRDKFLSINPITIDINNFPLAKELACSTPWKNKKNEVCYVGGIAKIRGIEEVCKAMSLIRSEVRLNLCGTFTEPEIEKKVKKEAGWQQINEHGYLDRSSVREVLSHSFAGIVTFYPLPNHIDAQPNKMFEYMSAGIPVIASDFPLWRKIIEGNKCGLLVDPMKPDQIAGAIDYLFNNPNEAQRMGKNGQKVVYEKYNWHVEEKKLFDFYSKVLS